MHTQDLRKDAYYAKQATTHDAALLTRPSVSAVPQRSGSRAGLGGAAANV